MGLVLGQDGLVDGGPASSEGMTWMLAPVCWRKLSSTAGDSANAPWVSSRTVGPLGIVEAGPLVAAGDWAAVVPVMSVAQDKGKQGRDPLDPDAVGWSGHGVSSWLAERAWMTSSRPRLVSMRAVPSSITLDRPRAGPGVSASALSG